MTAASTQDSQRHSARRIAVMVGQLGQGGTERQLYGFLSACDRDQWSPVVYVSGALGYWETPIRSLGMPVVLLRGNPIQKLWRFRALAGTQDPHCFFSWSSYTNAYAVALIGLRCVRMGSFRNAGFADLPHAYRRLWAWLSLAWISRAVCNSRETREAIASYAGPRLDAVYVPNSVEVPSPDAVRRAREEWRQRLEISNQTLLVLGVGRLTPQKRFDRFLEVIAHAKHIPEMKAVIAGRDMGCLQDLKAKADLLGVENRVRFLGSVADARELMCAADILLLTSDFEGMPNVVLEAMAAGVPCVTTCVNGVHDIIDSNRSGVITSGDVAEMSAAISLLAADADLRAQIGARAKSTVSERHRVQSVNDVLWRLCG